MSLFSKCFLVGVLQVYIFAALLHIIKWKRDSIMSAREPGGDRAEIMSALASHLAAERRSARRDHLVAEERMTSVLAEPLAAEGRMTSVHAEPLAAEGMSRSVLASHLAADERRVQAAA